MARRICVYCSSSSAVDDAYVQVARETGRLLGERGHPLVYGGADVGLMGVLARSAAASGARVVGVLPRAFRGLASPHLSELVLTSDLRERKAAMEDRSDAFLALPGGFGTLDELAEALTHRQLGIHRKPVAILNALGFYDALLRQFETYYEARFAKSEYRSLYHAGADPARALDYLERSIDPALPQKWWSAR